MVTEHSAAGGAPAIDGCCLGGVSSLLPSSPHPAHRSRLLRADGRAGAPQPPSWASAGVAEFPSAAAVHLGGDVLDDRGVLALASAPPAAAPDAHALSLSGSPRITGIPASLFAAPRGYCHLRQIVLDRCGLRVLGGAAVAAWARMSPGLEVLSLQANLLAEIPSGIGALQCLRVLMIDDNALRALPDDLCALSGLVELHVSGNAHLTGLPSGWAAGMTALRVFHAERCPFLTLPSTLPPALATLTGTFANVRGDVAATGRAARVRASLYASAALYGCDAGDQCAPEPLTLFATHRLRVRTMTLGDAPFVLAALNDPPFIANVRDAVVRTRADAEAYIRAGPLASCASVGYGGYVVELLGDDGGAPVPVGMCGFYKRPYLDLPDVGYTLLGSHWGRGYAREAVAAALAYGRASLGFAEVLAIISPGNEPSRRVAEACGLTRRGRVTVPGTDSDEVDVFHVAL